MFHKKVKDVLEIYLVGELDEHASHYIRPKLDALIESESFSKMVIDFRELFFMDSTGVGVLIGRYKKLSQRQIPLFLKNPSAQIDRIFRMSGLYKIMPLTV